MDIVWVILSQSMYLLIVHLMALIQSQLRQIAHLVMQKLIQEQLQVLSILARQP